MSRSDAVRWRDAEPGVVVFTNGVFDLLHVGHIDLLTVARALGDRLIVALNSDASVCRLKGPRRPVRTEAERAYVVAALECVDAVTVFDEDTPLEIGDPGARHLIMMMDGGRTQPELAMAMAAYSNATWEQASERLPGAIRQLARAALFVG